MTFHIFIAICCGVIVIALLVIYTIVADHRDIIADNEPQKNYVHLEKNRICGKLEGTGIISEVAETFEKIDSILNAWDTLYSDNQDFLSDQDDIEQLFRITIHNIESSCMDYKNKKCTKKELTEELDHQVHLLDQLLQKLASTAKSRAGYI